MDLRTHSLDLLCPDGAPRLDTQAMRQALAFAFATGDVGDVFESAIASASLPASDWRRADFADDVFLGDFVRRCLRVEIGGRRMRTSTALLERVLAAPPRDPAVLAYRQSILRELTDRPELRSELEAVYVDCVRLRDLLTSRTLAARLEGTRRRLEILRGIKILVDRMASGFASARSGLARLGRVGAALAQSDAYHRLSGLLEFEGNRCQIDVRIQIGFDGTIRSFRTLALSERALTPGRFERMRSWIERLWLMLRGYRAAGAELVNRYMDDVFTEFEETLVEVVQLTGDIEFYLAALCFADKARAAGLSVCLPVVGDDEPRRVTDLFNPWLMADDAPVVPCDLSIDRTHPIAIVTGPNSGGKTRLLQAIAITQILGQAGLFVPASSAHLPSASGLFVSLIENYSTDQREGRLGTEMLRIRRLFESVGQRSLIILDELCSGTNPSEGEEIFRLVVELLPDLYPDAFITTHFLAFAARLERAMPELEFLQVELDNREEPTFRFVPGVAATSLAYKTAERLGVTSDALRALVSAKKPRLHKRDAAA